MFNKINYLPSDCIKKLFKLIIRLMKKRCVIKEQEELKRLEERETFLPKFTVTEVKNYD